MGSLLVEAGEEEGEEEGGGGGRAQGLLNYKNNGRFLWQLSSMEMISRARPTETSKECARGMTPVSNQSSCALSMHTVEIRLQGL